MPSNTSPHDPGAGPELTASNAPSNTLSHDPGIGPEHRGLESHDSSRPGTPELDFSRSTPDYPGCSCLHLVVVYTSAATELLRQIEAYTCISPPDHQSSMTARLQRASGTPYLQVYTAAARLRHSIPLVYQATRLRHSVPTHLYSCSSPPALHTYPSTQL